MSQAGYISGQLASQGVTVVKDGKVLDGHEVQEILKIIMEDYFLKLEHDGRPLCERCIREITAG